MRTAICPGSLHLEVFTRQDVLGLVAAGHRDTIQLDLGRGWIDCTLIELTEEPLAATGGAAAQDDANNNPADQVSDSSGQCSLRC